MRARFANLKPADYARFSPFAARKKAQHAKLNLPLFPTTTIGSLPQTSEVRSARLRLRKGELTEEAYKTFIRMSLFLLLSLSSPLFPSPLLSLTNFFKEEKIREGIAFQEQIGIDVLVTGEFERNDMVEYFGTKLEGFAFTENGWVQSFGSRYE